MKVALAILRFFGISIAVFLCLAIVISALAGIIVFFVAAISMIFVDMPDYLKNMVFIIAGASVLFTVLIMGIYGIADFVDSLE